MTIAMLEIILAYLGAALLGAIALFGLCVVVIKRLPNLREGLGPLVSVVLLLGGAVYGAPVGAVLGVVLLWSFRQFGVVGPCLILGGIAVILLVLWTVTTIQATLAQAEEARYEASYQHSMQQVYRLLDAAREGDIAQVRACLEAGTFVDTFEIHDARYGETALMLAARKGNAALVHLLLERGARLHWRNGRGETAQMLARNAGFIAVADLLAKAETPVNPA